MQGIESLLFRLSLPCNRGALPTQAGLLEAQISGSGRNFLPQEAATRVQEGEAFRWIPSGAEE